MKLATAQQPVSASAHNPHSEGASTRPAVVIDPLTDRRWDELVARHPDAVAFHTRGWLEALARTYRYAPVALTTASPGEPLRDGLVLCHVESGITGRRGVSLPFTDHCPALRSEEGGIEVFEPRLREQCLHERWRYVELRPRMEPAFMGPAWTSGQTYCLHRLDLTPPLDEIFRAFHKGSLQRRIRRAEKEHLVCQTGRDHRIIAEFYALMCRTRRRHRVFPQPIAWFQNLAACMGEGLQIRVARKDGVAVAGLLSLHHRSRVIYKYGCSDERMHQLAAVPFLFWQLIQEIKVAGATELDLGRSDLDQPGLILFKDRLGAQKNRLTYLRYAPGPQTAQGSSNLMRWSSRAMRPIVPALPEPVFRGLGRLLYRHMG